MDEWKMAIEDARKYIGWAYSELKWLTDETRRKATKERDELLESISTRVNSDFNQSKLYCGELSPGCRACGDGKWSCIFIGRVCTAKCFYCPTDETQEAPPKAEQIVFDDPEDYCDFLERFDFDGVSFSGGEPFVKIDRMLQFLRAIRRRFGKRRYVWAYTNGQLVTAEKLLRLKETRLDEIRFNICAANYDLDRVRLASTIIKKVTVEIPAIPEDVETVKRLLPELEELGVSCLNLHQLMATSYNYRKLAEREYTFLHSPNIPILESELTALEIIRWSLDRGIRIPINYCSSVFKDRFQGKAKKKRAATVSREDFEEVTDAGNIRRIAVKGSAQKLRDLAETLAGSRGPEGEWRLDRRKNTLYVKLELLQDIALDGFRVCVSYFAPMIQGETPADVDSKEVRLNPNKMFYAVRSRVARFEDLGPKALDGFARMFLSNEAPETVLAELPNGYDPADRSDVKQIFREVMALKQMVPMERLGTGFQELY